MARQLTEEELNAIDAKYSSGNPMRAIANMANQMTPAHALQVYKASLSSGYAPELVATNLPAYKENEFHKVDWQQVMTASPKTYEFLANPMRMAAMGTVKNINSLSSIENEWKVTTAVKNSFKDLARGMLGAGIGAIESARLTAIENNQVDSAFSTNKAANVLTGITSNTLSAVVTPVLKKARDSELLKSKEVKGDTWLGQLGLDVTQQTGQLAMQLAAAYFSRGAALPTLLTGAYTAGSDYNELTEEGVETRRAWQAGVMDAAAQAPFERISIGKMLKKAPVGGSMAKEILEKALTEGITEWLQKYPEAITEIWAKNPKMTAQERTDEFVKNFWEITKEGAYEGLIGAILGGAGGAVSLSVQRQVLDNTITNMENQQRVLAGMDIDPAIKKEMLDNVLDGQKIYIEPKALLTLYQDGLISAKELDDLLGIDSRTVAANAKKGQLVEVPLANYQVAASQHPEIHQALKDDIATDEDGYTPRGLKTRNERDIKKYGEKAKQQRDEVRAAADEVITQWVASGALSKEDAKTVMAALISHARAYSSNPSQFIREKAPLFVKGTDTTARAMEQPLNSDVDPDRKVTAVDITTTLPTTIVTNNDLLSHIKGLVGNSGVISTADNKAIVDILPKDVRHIVYSSRKVSNTQLTVRKGSILSIADLLANAVLIESVPNTKTGTKPNVNVYHRFYVPVQFKDKVYTVRLVAEEQHGAITLDPTAINLYDVIVESKKPLLTNQPTSGGSSGLASANGSFDTTIREMLAGVKDAGGVKYFQYTGKNAKTASPAFRAWFGDSKVVDKKGKPLVVYHTGTMGDVYDMTKSRSYSGSPDYEIPGIYLTADKAESQEYGTPDQIKALYASIQNPYEGNIYELHKQLGTWRKVMDHLIEQGYDGIINDDGYGEIIAFHPEQIKSINNRTYDRNNQNIYYQAANEQENLQYGQQEQQITPEENIRRGSIAMDRVITEHTDVLNAMYRPEVGSISFYWGNPGKGPKLKKGGGVSHLIARRNSEGQDGEAVAMKMVEVIAKGSAGDVYGPETGKRVNITYDGHTAVLSLYKAGNIETWLLSGWKNNEEASGAIGEGYGSTDATLSEPMRTRLEEGADASLDINIPQPGELFQSQNNPRGSIHWDEEGRAIITMFQNADASTVIHELVGHYFIQNLLDEGAKDTAPDWMKQDRTKALDWASSQDVKQELAKLLASAERQNKQEEAAQFRDALAFVEAGGSTMDAATDSGHDHHQALKTAYHELLARAAEAYILEGKAPSVETRSLFRRFTEWLMEIYQDIKALGVTLNPEIRGVFDRMLASEDEISRMVDFEGYLQQLPPGFYNKLSERHKAEVDKLLANAEDKAKEQVRAHLMREFTDQNERLIQEEEQAALARITAEVKAMNRYQAEAVIEEIFGKKAKAVAQAYVGHQASPFGATSAAETIAIKRKLLEHMIETGFEEGIPGLQQEIDALVQKEAAKKDNMLQAAQQNEFEFIANTFKFTSGDHLAQELIAHNDSETSIRNRLDEHMTAFKKQLTDDEALHQSVEEAMYSDEGALLLAAEQRIIDEMLGKMVEKHNAHLESLRLTEVSRQAAAAEVDTLSLDKVMNLRVWISAERRAAENALMALANKDLKTAREQKAIQLFNHHMVQESLKARREFERVTKFLKRQRSSGIDTWMAEERGEGGTRVKSDRHFIQAADLLRRLGYARKDYKPESKQETLAEYTLQMEKDNEGRVNIPDSVRERKEDVIKLRQLKMGELQDIVDALRNIKMLVKAGFNSDAFYVFKDGLFVMGEELLAAAEKNVKDKLIDLPDKEDPGIIAGLRAGIRKPSKWLLQLDGFKEDVWCSIYYALSSAQDYKSLLVNRVLERIEKAYERAGISKEDRYNDAHKKMYIEEWGVSVSKNYLRAILLNMGNTDNLNRLFGQEDQLTKLRKEANIKPPVGQKNDKVWTQEKVTAVLVKYLTAKDIQLTQDIWDAIDLYEEYNKMVKQVTGSELKRVNPRPISFTMPDGQVIHLRGGYYRLKADPRSSKRAELNEAKRLGVGLGEMPYPNSGSTKERVNNARYQVDLDLSNLYDSVMTHAHDIAFRPVMLDLNKLMIQDEIKEVMRRKLGDARYLAIDQWIRVVGTGKNSTQQGTSILDPLANWARQRAVIANLLFRPGTILQNAANFLLYGNSVAGFSNKDALAAYVKYGWGEYIPLAIKGDAEAKRIRQFVYEKSPMMRDKMQNPDYTLRDMHNMKANWLAGSSNETVQTVGIKLALTHDMLLNLGSNVLAWADQLTDIPMWEGAYYQAVEQGKTEQEAVRFADSVIEASTGTGRTIDASLMQLGGPTAKLLTMFMSFINTQYNRWANEFKIYAKEKDHLRMITFVGTQYLMFGVLSALAALKWPDEEEDIWKWLLREVFLWPLGMIPIGGGMVKYVADNAMGNHTFGWALSPVERNVQQLLSVASKFDDVLTGKKEPGDLAEPMSQSAAFLFGFPDQINDWCWNAYDIFSDNMDPELRDLVRRRPRKERN